MAIAFNAAGATSSADLPASMTFAAPAGTAATDIVVCWILYGGGSALTFTPPSGWTLANRTDSGSSYGMVAYWAKGNAAFTAWTIANAVGATIGWTEGWTGVDNVTPMDATGVGQANASSVTVTAPSITTVTANAQLAAGFGWYSSTGAAAPTWSAVFGTSRKNASFTGTIVPDTTALNTSDAVQASAGASGTKTATASVANVNVGILLALRPAAGGGATAATIPLFGYGSN